MENNQKIASDIMGAFLNVQRTIENFIFFNLEDSSKLEIKEYMEIITKRVKSLEESLMKIQEFKNEYHCIIEEETKEETKEEKEEKIKE